VLQRLRHGEIDDLTGAVDQPTDLPLLCAFMSSLLEECANRFPDPRQEPEIPFLALLSASVTGAFQGE